MKPSVYIMLRAILAFIVATWFGLYAILLAYNGEAKTAIWFDVIAVFGAAFAAIEYEYAERTYGYEQRKMDRDTEQPER